MTLILDGYTDEPSNFGVPPYVLSLYSFLNSKLPSKETSDNSFEILFAPLHTTVWKP